MPCVSIAVLARAPVPGSTKTRLIPALGAEGAAALQSALMRRALATACAAQLGQVTLWCWPDCDHPAFASARTDFDVELVPQTGADLGERMSSAFGRLCLSGPTLLIGTDCPALNEAHLRDAATALASGSDAVIIPADDGGYVLIGLRRAIPSLFADMPWGSSDVLTETRARLRRGGWRWEELSALWDVDRPEDLRRLAESGLMPAGLGCGR